jgi:hypothetical protein
MPVAEAMPFRVTRNAEVELDPDDDSTLADQVEEELRRRRFERVVRLEYGPGGSPAVPGERFRTLDFRVGRPGRIRRRLGGQAGQGQGGRQAEGRPEGDGKDVGSARGVGSALPGR